MKGNLILELNRIKDMMGLLTEQQQVNTNAEDWKTYAGGKPYGLFELKATEASKRIINSNVPQDTIIGWKNAVKFRIPENKLTQNLRNTYDQWVSKPIVDGYLYTTQPGFGNLKSEQNPDYIQWVGNMLNQTSSLPRAANSKGGEYWGATIPGITPETKLGFMKYIENYVKFNQDNDYKRASRKVESIIIKKGKLTPQESEKIEPPINAVFNQFRLRGTDGEVFVDNSTELGEDTKNYIKETKTLIENIIIDNPGVRPTIVNQVSVNGKETNSTYSIFTSASRFRNTGIAENMTFAELSQKRAESVDAYIREQLGSLVEFPQPVINSAGSNGDGSSGPNPPEEFAFVTKDGKVNKTDNKGRDDFGTPLRNKEDYEQFKYCNLVFGISFGGSDPVEKVPPGKILGSFSILIDDNKERKRIKIPPIEFIRPPDGGGSGGGHIGCSAYS